MTRLILPICIISLLSGCQDANPAEREWKEQLYKNLAIVGARNWIVIAESSFPAYTGTGIRTMVLVIKTKTSLPYSNIYIELDSGYWNSESETVLRKSLEAKDTANRRAAQDRVLDVPLVPGATPAPQGNKENPPMPGAPASPADNLPELPRENRQPASPSGDKAPGVPPPPIRDPLGGKTAIARFS